MRSLCDQPRTRLYNANRPAPAQGTGWVPRVILLWKAQGKSAQLTRTHYKRKRKFVSPDSSHSTRLYGAESRSIDHVGALPLKVPFIFNLGRVAVKRDTTSPTEKNPSRAGHLLRRGSA